LNVPEEDISVIKYWCSWWPTAVIVGSEMVTAVITNSYWDVTPRSSVHVDQHFSRSYLPNQMTSHFDHIKYSFYTTIN
jgi:hypothetical protein